MSEDELNREIFRRTRRSLITGVSSIALGVAGWQWLWKQEEIDGLPWPLRKSLRFNEILGRILYDNRNLTVRPEAPPMGAPVRVNGDLGLRQTQPGFGALEISAPEGFTRILPFATLRSFPRTHTTTEFKCIEGWGENMSYAGVRLADFLAAFPLRERYAYVGFETPNRGYYVSIDMESALHPQTVLVDEMNGVPLRPENGAPLRLLIPVKYGIKSLKNIGRIYFSNIRPPDYWAERGYDWYAGL